MLIHFKVFNKKNSYILKSFHIHFNYFYSDYQITNDAQLGEISEMSD